jgi:hypothetical protein
VFESFGGVLTQFFTGLGDLSRPSRGRKRSPMSSAARRSASAVARAYTWSVSVTLECRNLRCAVFTSTPAATMADAATERRSWKRRPGTPAAVQASLHRVLRHAEQFKARGTGSRTPGHCRRLRSSPGTRAGPRRHRAATREGPTDGGPRGTSDPTACGRPADGSRRSTRCKKSKLSTVSAGTPPGRSPRTAPSQTMRPWSPSPSATAASWSASRGRAVH